MEHALVCLCRHVNHCFSVQSTQFGVSIDLIAVICERVVGAAVRFLRVCQQMLKSPS